jgi:putative membrane protein
MTPAWAHSGTRTIEPIGWSFEPWLVIPILLSAIVYAVGSEHLKRRGRADRRLADLLFWCGLGTLSLALMSPLHALGERMFTAHMIEHEVLMVISAPLLVLSKPAGCLLWGLPGQIRVLAVPAAQHQTLKLGWKALTELWTATALHAVTLWAWHAPALFHAALDNEAIHVLQHASFFFSAILFWSAVLRRQGVHQAYGPAILALFLTSLQAGMLGALLTFSRVLWYPFAPDPFPICGLSSIEDQALAGLVMWIPACMVYVVAALALSARWLFNPEVYRVSR